MNTQEMMTSMFKYTILTTTNLKLVVINTLQLVPRVEVVRCAPHYISDLVPHPRQRIAPTKALQNHAGMMHMEGEEKNRRTEEVDTVKVSLAAYDGCTTRRSSKQFPRRDTRSALPFRTVKQGHCVVRSSHCQPPLSGLDAQNTTSMHPF